MSRTRYRFFDNQTPYFLTFTVINWIPLFIDPLMVNIILDSLRFAKDQKQLILYAYVIMENHLHLIASSPNLSKHISEIKSFTARKMIELLIKRKSLDLLKMFREHKLHHKQDRLFQIWQEGSHPQVIQNERMMGQKINYIHMNPVRRGYIDEPEHWRYSSSRNYKGVQGLLEVCTSW